MAWVLSLMPGFRTLYLALTDQLAVSILKYQLQYSAQMWSNALNYLSQLFFNSDPPLELIVRITEMLFLNSDIHLCNFVVLFL